VAIQYNSSHVQQNFGRVMDQAITDQEVVVERYGEPRIVILDYRRYLQLLSQEQELIRMRLRQASAAASQRAAALTDAQADGLIEQARSEVYRPAKRRRAPR
jgi:PHD/YefM family antitoxin component YafN of YafNO toxin-antitoxin module